jgi:hypothetical protein
VTSGIIGASENPDVGLVMDGTPCGENLVCNARVIQVVYVWPCIFRTNTVLKTNNMRKM